MLPELIVSFVVVAVDSRFLDGPVHPLDLTVGPRMVGLGQAVLDAVGSADLVDAGALLITLTPADPLGI